MIDVTPAAVQEILAAAQRSSAVGMALRVAARQVADGSIEYGMGFDEEREDDTSAEIEGLTVLVGSPSRPLLEGTVLDYVELAPGRFDFVFVPLDEPVAAAGSGSAEAAPQASGGGGCGSGGCGSGRCGA
jgi:iron-sulfur cluster assembly protein